MIDDRKERKRKNDGDADRGKKRRRGTENENYYYQKMKGNRLERRRLEMKGKRKSLPLLSTEEGSVVTKGG